MSVAGTITVYLTADMAEFQAGLEKAGAALTAWGDKVTAKGASIVRVGQNLTYGLTLPLGLAGGAAIKFAATFDENMTKIETLVGVSRNQVNAWRKDLLALAPAVGVTPVKLSEALFAVTSAGIRSAEALNILKLSAEASAVGLGDTTDIARTVTAAMQAYSKEGLTAAQATDILVATVRAGNLTATELAGSLGRVYAIAAQLGVSMAQVGGFVATFTREGVNADEAVTALRGVLSGILKPAKQAQQALDFSKLREVVKTQGLDKALVMMLNAFKGQSNVIGELVPRVRALAGWLGVAGAQGGTYLKITDQITHSNGILAEAFKRTTETTAFTWKSFVAQAQALAIVIGDQLAPSFQSALGSMQGFMTHLASMVQLFAQLPKGIRNGTIDVLGFAAAAGPLVFIFGEMIKAVGTVAGAFSGLVSSLGGLEFFLGPGGLIAAGLVVVIGLFLRLKVSALEAKVAEQQAVQELVQSYAGLDLKQTTRALNASADAMAKWKARLDAAKAQAASERAAAQANPNESQLGGMLKNGGVSNATMAQIANYQQQYNRAKALNDALEQQFGQLQKAKDKADAKLAAALAGQKTPLEKAVDSLVATFKVAESNRSFFGNTLANNLAQDKAELSALHVAFSRFLTDGLNPGSKSVINLANQIKVLTDRVKAEEAAVKAATSAQRKSNQEQRAALAMYHQYETPQQRQKDEIARAQMYLKDKKLSKDQYDTIITGIKAHTDKATHSFIYTMKQQGLQAGEALIRGILTGSGNMGDILKNALINLAITKMMGPLKLLLGIASPSKVFYGYGQQIGLGLAYGISSTAGHVHNASMQLAGAAMGGMGGAIVSPGAHLVMGAGRLHVDVSQLPKPMTPFEVARDNAWLKVLGLSNTELGKRGGVATSATTS